MGVIRPNCSQRLRVPGKHRLSAGIPRVLADHRTAEGRRYGAYCRAVLARLPGLPASALPTVQQCGWLVVELDRLTLALNAAHVRNRRRDAARIRRAMVTARTQLLRLEERL